MTRNSPDRKKKRSVRTPSRWPLQDAKARFSELVKLACTAGPQHVTVHGEDTVVVVSAEEFRRLHGDQTGDALVKVMQSSPHRDIEIESGRSTMPVRAIDL